MSAIQHTIDRLTALQQLLESGKPIWEVWAAYARDVPEHGTCKLCDDYPGCSGCPIFKMHDCNCKHERSLAQRVKSELFRPTGREIAHRFLQMAIDTLKEHQ